MLEHTAPIVETGGFEGRLVGMLRDAGENINWRQIPKVPRDPNYQPEAIYAHDMPLPPGEDDSGWGFHRWVLGTKGWDAYRNKYGVPVELGPDGAPLWNADPNFAMDKPAPVDTDADMIGAPRPRYGVEMEHDFEAGGSASQTGDGFVSALFGAPPPATYATSWEQDPWELRTTPADAESAGLWDPWAASTGRRHSTGTQHMYMGEEDEDMGDDNEDMGEEDLGEVSPQRQVRRRVQPHRDGKGIAAPRLSLSGRRRR